LGARFRARAVLRWSAGPLTFELSSPHEEVLERGRIILGPWLNRKGDSRPARVRFVIEAEVGSTTGHWRVKRNGNGAGSIAESIDLALARVEYGAAAEIVRPGSGIVTVHAALLSRDARGILLVGPKESGKSTFACALLAAGWALHSDDTTVLDHGARARGIPRRVSLRATSRELLGENTWKRILDLPGTSRLRSGVLFHPAEAWRRDAPSSVKPVAVVMLARRGATAGPGRLEPLDAGRALLALALYCNRREEGMDRALEALRALADRVPAFDLGRGNLATMIARVEEAVRMEEVDPR
jgi:hypothetical protein